MLSIERRPGEKVFIGAGGDLVVTVQECDRPNVTVIDVNGKELVLDTDSNCEAKFWHGEQPVTITLIMKRGSIVRLGIEAPRLVPILRGDAIKQTRQHKRRMADQ